MRRGIPRGLNDWLPHLALAVLVVVSAFPLYWIVVSSLTPEAVLFGGTTLVPRELVLDHYRALFDERNFWIPIRNSLIVAGSTTLLAVTLGSLAA